MDTVDADDPFFAFVEHTAPQSKESAGSAPHAIFDTGSGFIVSANAAILATAHAVEGADEVTVIDRQAQVQGAGPSR
jgi:S1-C subfamily serine protease